MDRLTTRTYDYFVGLLGRKTKYSVKIEKKYSQNWDMMKNCLHCLSEQRFASTVEDDGVLKEHCIEYKQQILQTHVRTSQRDTPFMCLLVYATFLVNDIGIHP